MILTCPNCGTQYVVKDGAIPPQGRQVRCASCKHSWHQDPEGGEEQVEQDETIAEATLIDPRSGPEAEERAYDEAVVEAEAPQGDSTTDETASTQAGDRGREEMAAEYAAEQRAQVASADFDSAESGEAVAVPADWSEPPEVEPADDEFSPFPIADDAGPEPRSPLVKILIAALVVAAIAAAFYFLAPEALKAKLGLGTAATSQLALVTTHMDRQKLESGNELLTVTGRVVNPTAKEQDVPPLQAQLKSRAGKVVYSWTIQPPARSLPAGASASFNSAEVNVPPGGDELTITLGTAAS